jgi:hypothetical protein
VTPRGAPCTEKYHHALFATSCGEFWQSDAVCNSNTNGAFCTTSIMFPLSNFDENTSEKELSGTHAATAGDNDARSITNVFVTWLSGGAR